MSEETGLYDKITIGGETFRKWHSTPTIEVMQDGVWTSIPYVAQRAILAAVAAEREACAKIADALAAEPWGHPEQGTTCEHIAAVIRARGQTT